MNSKQLKILALISMFFDHFIRIFSLTETIFPIGDWLIAKGLDSLGIWFTSWLPSILAYFGRLAAPIFMFCIVQGFLHTKDIRKYIWRIYVTAFLAQVPYILFDLAQGRLYGIKGDWREVPLNILFTLGLGLLSLLGYRKCEEKGKRMLGIGIIVLAGVLARLLRFEGSEGYIFIIFMLYIMRNSSLWKKVLIFLPVVIFSRYRLVAYTLEDLNMLRSCVLNILGPYLGILVTCRYSGEKGNINRRFQRFMYWFYPLHLLVLAIVGYLRPPFL
ncbi:hypothetical protein CIW83_20840 [Tissierella sp. P1]|uniref:TraX family protein n=1 Tax=Tissierella TaxID=41273 RepID=UPI000B9FE349|nr:TraX family protein [Tissierella sp. P1]OZV10340.1 hypothetical protein CIW83_20840 [Tissierella sp. P1]